MDTRKALVLRHKPTGLYYSKIATHTTKLWDAWRFMDEEQLGVWMQTHSYAPVNQMDYEAVSVRLTIEEVTA